MPRKRFSQNFLHDTQVIQRIVEAIAPQAGEHLVEIGPGLGALTIPLLRHTGFIDAIELDRDLLAPLIKVCEPVGRLQLHAFDVLQFDFAILTQQPGSLRIVGNLPYHISTALLFYLIPFLPWIKDIHVMLQKEVVARMAASVNTKAYGRLSVMLQYHFSIFPLFTVANTAFYPIPKVTSQIVRLIPRKIEASAFNYTHFSELVRQVFNYRRKTLRHSLRGWIAPADLLRLEIDPNSRPAQLTVADFINMSHYLLPRP